MTTPATEHHEALVREWATLNDEAARIKARLDEIGKVLRHDLPLGSHEIAGLKVTLSRNATFDAAAFADAYPVAQHPYMYEAKPATAAIKRHLAPAELERFQREGDPRLTIR